MHVLDFFYICDLRSGQCFDLPIISECQHDRSLSGQVKIEFPISMGTKITY